jgi:hypothetical protein
LGKTLAELQESMTPAEFESWRAFYRLFPFDDEHRYYRPAAMVSVSLSGGDFQSRVDLLQPPPELTTEADPVRFAIKKALR